MPMECYVVPIVESRSFESSVVHSKAGNANYMQFRARCRTEPGDITCIRRYFRFNQCDMKHTSTL